MTKTAAVRQARDEHGCVAKYSSGPYGYSYAVWSKNHKAWLQPSSTFSYAEARKRRSCSIYERAAELMFGPDEYGFQPFFADKYGDAREQFSAFLAAQNAH